MSTARVIAFLFTAGIVAGTEPTTPGELHNFFANKIGLNEGQMARIARGEAVAKILPSTRTDVVVVFGAVFVESNSERYLKYSSDLERLQRLPGYLGVGRLSEEPTLEELKRFTLEQHDITSLKTCRPGKCGLQLSVEAMQWLQEPLHAGSGAVEMLEVNRRVQHVALDVVKQYRERGNVGLGVYRDDEVRFDVEAELRSWLKREEVLPLRLPALTEYLLEYPQRSPAQAETWFYWEKVSFGLKPTLRLNHAVAYRSGGAQVVAVKQLYASHYLQLALDISECVPGRSARGNKGFYLISLRGSAQRGLTGWAGALLKRIIQSKARATQQRALDVIRKDLEGMP